jgi:hypothetical protein
MVLEDLEELLKIYDKTDPKLGPTSEKGKHWAALWAIYLAQSVVHTLTDWAENHIAGAIYRRAHTRDKSTFDWDNHANEKQIYVEADGLSLTAEQFREYISTVLEQCPRRGRDWRHQLSEGLKALNDGEVQFLTKPSRTSKHGRPYTLRHLRWLAVLHVHVLVGTGLKKYAAESKVADELAQSVETLRAWEKQFLKSDDRRRTVRLARKLARYGMHDFANPSQSRSEVPQFRNDQERDEYYEEWTLAHRLWMELLKHPLRDLARELRNARARP